MADEMSRIEGNIGTMRKKCSEIAEWRADGIAVADAAMWSVPRATKDRNLIECRTILLELFAGPMLLSATMAGEGSVVSQPADI